MCGIAGFLDTRPACETTVLAMADALRHRGPDDSGAWVDAEAGIALGFRRLAIIDLSPTGRQPMMSADGRYVIIYNGEIYNYQDVAARLRQSGVAMRGRSDTEVLLEGIARWGLRETLAQCEGMFAFALWDRRSRALTLARDRMGIKPLYWGSAAGAILFGSELKALRRHPAFDSSIDRDALSAYLRFGYVPAPFSIYRNIRKLEPGTLLTVTSGNRERVERYWDLRKVAAQGCGNRLAGSAPELLHELEGVLRRAVRNEMIADVPLGAFLSGGIDSSLVTALMQAESPRPVKTFSIGFEYHDYDEAQHAKRVANHLGTDHTEFCVEDGVAREVIPSLPIWYDEPFADSSQIPTHIVSRLARRHVTVALSGDGGDELFAGYTRYRWGARVWGATGAVPTPLRRGLATLLEGLPAGVPRAFTSVLPERRSPQLPQQKLQKLAQILRQGDAQAAYRSLASLWPEPDRVVVGGHEPHGLPWQGAIAREFPNLTDRMQVLDAMTYLPDDILTKVDRASMATSLEVRVPLLNHRVVEFAWHLPRTMKLKGTTTKWALRQLLHRFVPQNLVERPKHGFSVPLEVWLRGPLRDWAEDLLSDSALVQDGWLHPAPIRHRWREHQAGRKDWSHSLWCVLMFQSWRAHERRSGSPC